MATSPDAKGCTGSYSSVRTFRRGVEYEFIDTVGLNEPDGGKVKKSEALKLFLEFLRENKEGFSLIVFCSREPRLTVESKATYDIMVKKLYSTQGEAPPVVIIVGGLFLEYDTPQDWCSKNRYYYSSQGCLEADDEERFLCISLPAKAKNEDLEKSLYAIRTENAKKAWDAIENAIAPWPVPLWRNWENFWSLSNVLWNMVASFFGWPEVIPEQLLRNFGFTKEEFAEVLNDL